MASIPLSIRFIKTCRNPNLSRAGARVLVDKVEIRLAFEHGGTPLATGLCQRTIAFGVKKMPGRCDDALPF
jgi:hypothetical protein